MSAHSPSQLLLRHLADGRFHSGQVLADVLGVSRTAIWKQVRRLQDDYGMTVHAVRGRGYRLASALELLDRERVQAHIGGLASARLERLTLVATTSSTNSDAAADPPLRSGRGRVWLAEHQTAGRGRRGRDWISSYGSNVTLSLAWRFDLPMSALSALSLAAGVATAEALRDVGVEGHTLKWPNDLLVDGRKLAGVLVEVFGEAGGPATAVIGVGINTRLPAASAQRIDQPWTDLDTLGGDSISRNALAGTLVDRLVNACEMFAREGIGSCRERWQSFDKLLGSVVRLYRGDRFIEGRYAGIAADGALILETDDGCSAYHAGELSLRRADA